MGDGHLPVPGLPARPPAPAPFGPAPAPSVPAAAPSGPGGHEPGQCRRIAPVLQRVGDKWTILVVMTLGPGPLRYNELRRRVDGISQRMLTLTVRALERDGFVSRTVTPTIPPAVSYDLTPMGRSLLDPVRILGAWAAANLPGIEAARERYDALGPGSGP